MALNPFVYFYARLAHVLTPGILYAPMPTKGFGFQFVTIDRDLSPPSAKGASPNFQKGPDASERDQYPRVDENNPRNENGGRNRATN